MLAAQVLIKFLPLGDVVDKSGQAPAGAPGSRQTEDL